MSPTAHGTIRLFLCADVMLSRGIDQLLPSPCNPCLHEVYARSALDYVRLAEAANGPMERPVTPAYVWGAALDEWERMHSDARIINLETSITRGEDYAPKGINYRMSRENTVCLAAAGIDCCVLANNHVLDWGRSGLWDTLAALRRHNIANAGAGRNLAEAAAPAILVLGGKGRVLVFSFALMNSGTPRAWAATAHDPGVDLLRDLSEPTVDRIADEIGHVRQPCDIVVVSIHWGPNRGYEINDAQTWFTHALIERAGVSAVHGHSSHHAKAIELYNERLILYGCGDFLDDYEGLEGYEGYRSDLSLRYLVDISPATGMLVAADIVPLQIRNFRLNRPTPADFDWLKQTLDLESGSFGTHVLTDVGGRLLLRSPAGPLASCR